MHNIDNIGNSMNEDAGAITNRMKGFVVLMLCAKT